MPVTKNKPIKMEESTAIATVETDGYLALSPEAAEGAMEALASIESIGETIRPEDLIRVQMPSGGGTKWMIPDGVGGEDYAEAIEGILVYIAARGILWPTFDAVEGTSPVLVSHDLKTAEQVGPIPDSMLDVLEKHKISEGVYDWAKLPYNEFGTGKEGRGKRCKEQRLLFILRPGDLYPVVVTAGPGSLANVRKFVLNLPQAAKAPYWRCVVSVGLEPATAKVVENDNGRVGGEKFCKVKPSLVGVLTREQGAVIKEKFTDVLAGVAREITPNDA